MAQTIDQATRDAMMSMIGLARSGRHAEARAAGKKALPYVGDRGPVDALLGRLACEAGDFDDGISHLRDALGQLPDDPAVRMDMAAALIQTGRFQEVLDVLPIDRCRSDASFQLARFRGYAAQAVEDYESAIEAYRLVVAAVPDDAGTWNNLGNAEAGLGRFDDAVESLTRASKLDPGSAPTRINLAQSLASSGKAGEALALLDQSSRDFPSDYQIHFEHGRLAANVGDVTSAISAYDRAHRANPQDPESLAKLGGQKGIAWDLEGAAAAYRAALALSPALAEAHIGLAILAEQQNDAAGLEKVAADARAAWLEPGAQAYIDAMIHRRHKRWEDGLAAATAANPSYDAIRRMHLIGEFNDRLQRPEAAFAAFDEMNRLVAEAPHGPMQLADLYRDQIANIRATISREWFDGWTAPVARGADEPATPVFLCGFPRSGTTLLDTMLMGHPGVRVLEEQPAFPDVERSIGDVSNLATMSSDQIAAARADYWEGVRRLTDLSDHALLIDKSPLYLNKVQSIRRLFPDARFILALRHPMDVVLSCYITNFRPNAAMSNFLTLERAAELYDASFSAFEEADRLLGLDVFPVVYERMVEDQDAELKPLFDWLGLDWADTETNHLATAAKRGVITTASYAQVNEPIYKRSAGRWARYRKQLEPVVPILQPWIDRLGYSLDDPTKVPERGTSR